MLYTSKVMDHFSNPRNVGVIEDADGVAEIGNPTCGDTVKITIKVKDNRIQDIKFQTMGCAAAIASGSITTEMARGLSLDEALEQITKENVLVALGGLPEQKVHCSLLATDGLRAAIENYRQGGPQCTPPK